MKEDIIRTKFYDSIITMENLPFEFECSNMSEPAQSNWHFDTEFLLFTADGSKVICGTNTYFPQSGDIIVVNSGKTHTVEPLPGEVASYQFVIPDRKFCAKYGINTTKLKFSEKITDEKITNAFLDFSAAVSLHGTSPNITTAAKCVNTLLSFMILVCENYIVSESYGTLEKKTTIDYIRKTVEYIHENYNKNIDLDLISAHIGVSKFHLAREFKKYTGNTVVNHINNVRCKEAEGYIMDGMSVEEAAFASGFNSLAHFSKTYKKINGVSPVTVRKAKGK